MAVIALNTEFSQNLDFENWIADTITVLNDYETITTYDPINGVLTTKKSTDAYSGMYSLSLETIFTENGDKVFGYFANGDPETMEGGNELTTLTAVDSIIGFYKYDIKPNDTALILCVCKSSGIPTGGDVFTITGTQNTWTRFAYPVDAVIADSFIVAAASSNAINNLGIDSGSYIMLDSIFLKSNTQGIEYIPNHSFENWTDIIWEDLDKWTTYNKYFVGQAIMPVEKTTDSYSGNFASILTTQLMNGTDTIEGAMTYGEWTMSGPIGGVPFSGDPEFIRFYYKSNLSGIDTARVEFAFKNNGNITDYYPAQIINNELSYTLYEIPVALSQTPDTVFLYVNAGKNPSSMLVIDDIEFVLPVGITEMFKINEIVAFPIPATDKLNFEINTETYSKVKISIYNTLGKLVSLDNFTINAGTQNLSLDISDIKAGNYIYKIEINDEVFSKTFIKK